MAFRSDSWNDPNAIVRDYYGNRMTFGTLKTLKERGYYNNKEAKSASTNGTYKTYGEEYSIDREHPADPTKYTDEV